MNALALFFFPLIMAYAASSDLLTMRISNRLIAALVIGFAVVALLMHMPLFDVGQHLAAGAIVLGFAFAFFAFGWIGGGDAKLASASVLWLGLGATTPYLIYASLLGGALTLFILMARRWPLPERLAAISWIDRLHNNKSGIPYGIALALAGLVVAARAPWAAGII